MLRSAPNYCGAVALAAATGKATLSGSAASALAQAQAPSPFQRDPHQFGLVIDRLALGLVVVVLAARVMPGRPALDSLLFSVALAVGLTPALLPMITTVTLSRGALRMARSRRGRRLVRLCRAAGLAAGLHRADRLRLSRRGRAFEAAGAWRGPEERGTESGGIGRFRGSCSASDADRREFRHAFARTRKVRLLHDLSSHAQRAAICGFHRGFDVSDRPRHGRSGA